MFEGSIFYERSACLTERGEESHKREILRTIENDKHCHSKLPKALKMTRFAIN